MWCAGCTVGMCPAIALLHKHDLWDNVAFECLFPLVYQCRKHLLFVAVSSNTHIFAVVHFCCPYPLVLAQFNDILLHTTPVNASSFGEGGFYKLRDKMPVHALRVSVVAVSLL